jgi:NTP pyrophosphatase (non-canonical NTP hydrolase)
MATHIPDLVSPWHPITDPFELKVLGKLGEEAGELSSVVSRCIIQGILECHPLTGKVNKEWLEEEIADVLASIAIAQDSFDLNREAIRMRVERKRALLIQWHAGA